METGTEFEQHQDSNRIRIGNRNRICNRIRIGSRNRIVTKTRNRNPFIGVALRFNISLGFMNLREGKATSEGFVSLGIMGDQLRAP